MKIQKLYRPAIALFYLGVGAVTLIFARGNYKPIYRGFRYFMDHESFKIALRKLTGDPAFAELIRTNYNPRNEVAWDVLRSLPAGTLGFEFAKFRNHPEVTALADFPEAKTEITPEVDYIRRRLRLTHDIHHVICGYPATEFGEMGISAFYVALISSPVNAMLLSFSIAKTLIKTPDRMHELLDVISEGWENGKRAKNFLGAKYEELWDRPVIDLRALWNVTPALRVGEK